MILTWINIKVRIFNMYQMIVYFHWKLTLDQTPNLLSIPTWFWDFRIYCCSIPPYFGKNLLSSVSSTCYSEDIFRVGVSGLIPLKTPYWESPSKTRNRGMSMHDGDSPQMSVHAGRVSSTFTTYLGKSLRKETLKMRHLTLLIWHFFLEENPREARWAPGQWKATWTQTRKMWLHGLRAGAVAQRVKAPACSAGIPYGHRFMSGCSSSGPALCYGLGKQ